MAREILIQEPPLWYSYPDEKAFFDRLESLRCVKSIVGKPDGLHIALKRPPTDSQLREFCALLYRYGVDMTSLAALKTERNAKWFAEPEKYWHAKVFGRRPRKSKSLKTK